MVEKTDKITKKVKNNTIVKLGPAKVALPNGALRVLGGARCRAIAGQDVYGRGFGGPWCIESVIEGKGWVEKEGEKMALRAGDVYIMGPKSEYRYGPFDGHPWEKVFVEVEGSLMNSLMEAYGLHDACVLRSVGASKGLEELVDLLQGPQEKFTREFPIALHQLLSELSSVGSSQSHSEMDYIEFHLDREFKLEDMARHFHCSKNQLLRRFKNRYKVSPYECLLQKRVDQAVWLLANTSTPIKVLADRLRFSDAKHLSSTLRRRTERSPSEWRASGLPYRSLSDELK